LCSRVFLACVDYTSFDSLRKEPLADVAITALPKFKGLS
jgi:hypothetical protein